MRTRQQFKPDELHSAIVLVINIDNLNRHRFVTEHYMNTATVASPVRCRQCFSTMKRLLAAIIMIGLTACNQPSPNRYTKTMDFGGFSIQTPQSWQQIKARGTDSFVGRIAIDEKDTLDFDLGWYSNTLTESDPAIMDRSKLQHFKQIGQPLD